jgi:hypothetical protein
MSNGDGLVAPDGIWLIDISPVFKPGGIRTGQRSNIHAQQPEWLLDGLRKIRRSELCQVLYRLLRLIFRNGLKERSVIPSKACVEA